MLRRKAEGTATERPREDLGVAQQLVEHVWPAQLCRRSADRGIYLAKLHSPRDGILDSRESGAVEVSMGHFWHSAVLWHRTPAPRPGDVHLEGKDERGGSVRLSAGDCAAGIHDSLWMVCQLALAENRQYIGSLYQSCVL